MKFCKKCGAKNSTEHRFCTQCGSGLETNTKTGPKLVILAERSGNVVFAIKGERITIGRDMHNDLVIDDPQISKYHAHVVLESEQLMIEDLESRNGVYLNGKKIHEKSILTNGALIKLGSTILKFEMS